MHFPNKKLEKEVAALIQRPTSSWAVIGLILDRVEREKYWARDARSFSEWLRSFAPKIGMKETSLWRYLGATRYYRKLRKDGSPSLARIPKDVSAENLELLEKLERVVPEDEFEAMAKRVLAGEVERNELRELWRTYRPILRGRTARGKGVIVPRIDPKDREQLMDQKEAWALTTLMAAGPEWTGIEHPDFYKCVREVILPRWPGVEPRHVYDPKEGVRYRPVVDMLAVVRKSPDSAVILVGVQVFSDLKTSTALASLAPYCDRLYVALLGKEELSDQVPEFVGILRLLTGSVQVEREPRPGFAVAATKSGELAKELLPHLLRG
jgi:hypothetical protein